jgi:hypothetical protein
VAVDLKDHVPLAKARAGGCRRGLDAGDHRAESLLGEVELAPSVRVDVADADAVEDALVVGALGVLVARRRGRRSAWWPSSR